MVPARDSDQPGYRSRAPTRQGSRSRGLVRGPARAASRLAVAIVNESEYGLTSAIYRADTTRAFRVSRRIDVGMVFIPRWQRNA